MKTFCIFKITLSVVILTFLASCQKDTPFITSPVVPINANLGVVDTYLNVDNQSIVGELKAKVKITPKSQELIEAVVACPEPLNVSQ